MKWIVRSLLGLLVLIVLATLHYTLPQRDIVRITGTEIIRQDFSGLNRMFYAQADSGNVDGVNRDLRLINTVRANGSIMVFRNEDTGFGWPPYFKFDSTNLQAEAQELTSTRDNPQWFAIRHYGWRNEFLTIFPNAVSLKPVAGPDVTLIPWFNILFLLVLAALIWGITVRVIRFRKKRIDPVIEDIDEAFDAAGDTATGLWGRFTAWLGTWRGKPRV